MRTSLLTLGLGLALLGCKKGDDEPAGAKGAKGAKGAAVEPFKGELTEDVLMNANRAISVYTPDGKPAEFSAALATAKQALGEPTHVEGTTYAWGFASGDKCSYYSLVDEGGKAKSSGSQTIDKMMRSGYEKCLAAIGKPPPAGSADEAGGSAAPAGSDGTAGSDGAGE